MYKCIQILLTKNNCLVFFLIMSINILCYDNSALGREDNDDDDDGNNKNNGDGGSGGADDDRKDKKEKKNNGGDKDDPPFILPLPFP